MPKRDLQANSQTIVINGAWIVFLAINQHSLQGSEDTSALCIGFDQTPIELESVRVGFFSPQII